MSVMARILNGWLRRVERPAMTRAAGPEALRRRFDFQARLFFHAPRGTQMRWQTLEHEARTVEALEVVPRTLESDTVLLFLHGGGFVFGSPRGYSALVAQLAKRLDARAVIPRYRLAPEAPFPAAFDDVRTAWDGLLQSGVPPEKIVIGGDSAGGALTLSLLGQLIQDGAALPAAAFCFSPLTDLSFGGESFRSNAQVEAVLPVERAREMAQLYLNGVDAENPQASPLFANFVGAPPVWITAGDTEILRDDARRVAQIMGRDGVDVTYIEVHDLPHVWPLFHNILPEARSTLDNLAGWIRRELVKQGES